MMTSLCVQLAERHAAQPTPGLSSHSNVQEDVLALRGALGYRRDDVLLRLARTLHLGMHARGQKCLHVLLMRCKAWPAVRLGGTQAARSRQ
jgi:thiamine pyrophosphokinase